MKLAVCLLSLSLFVASPAIAQKLSDSTVTTLLYQAAVNHPAGLTAEDIALIIEWAESVDTLPRFNRILLDLVLDGRATIKVVHTTTSLALTFIILHPPEPDGSG